MAPRNWLTIDDGHVQDSKIKLLSHARPAFPKQLLPFRNEWEFANLLQV